MPLHMRSFLPLGDHIRLCYRTHWEGSMAGPESQTRFLNDFVDFVDCPPMFRKLLLPPL